MLTFLTIEWVGSTLKNPFENRPNDTPMSSICRTVERDLRSMLEEEEIPEPLAAVDVGADLAVDLGGREVEAHLLDGERGDPPSPRRALELQVEPMHAPWLPGSAGEAGEDFLGPLGFDLLGIDITPLDPATGGDAAGCALTPVPPTRP